jgi:hypothetical protein
VHPGTKGVVGKSPDQHSAESYVEIRLDDLSNFGDLRDFLVISVGPLLRRVGSRNKQNVVIFVAPVHFAGKKRGGNGELAFHTAFNQFAVKIRKSARFLSFSIR